MSAETLAQLRATCRARGTTVGSALAACAARAFAALSEDDEVPVKVLQSLDMRRFGKDKATDRLACRAGSMDLFLKPADGLWDMSREAGAQLQTFEGRNFGEQSVRVFDWAVDAMEMTRLVELESDNPFTLGRAYCCGVSNHRLYRGAARRRCTTRRARRARRVLPGVVRDCPGQALRLGQRRRRQCCKREAFATLFVVEATNAASSVEEEANTLVPRAADDAQSVYEWFDCFGLGAALARRTRRPCSTPAGWRGLPRTAATKLRPTASAFFATMHPLIGGAGGRPGRGQRGFPATRPQRGGAGRRRAAARLPRRERRGERRAAPNARAVRRGFVARPGLLGTVSSGLAGTSGDNGSPGPSPTTRPSPARRGRPGHPAPRPGEAAAENGFDVTAPRAGGTSTPTTTGRSSPRSTTRRSTSTSRRTGGRAYDFCGGRPRGAAVPARLGRGERRAPPTGPRPGPASSSSRASGRLPNSRGRDEGRPGQLPGREPVPVPRERRRARLRGH